MKWTKSCRGLKKARRGLKTAEHTSTDYARVRGGGGGGGRACNFRKWTEFTSSTINYLGDQINNALLRVWEKAYFTAQVLPDLQSIYGSYTLIQLAQDLRAVPLILDQTNNLSNAFFVWLVYTAHKGTTC